jgi:hypothetical protein
VPGIVPKLSRTPGRVRALAEDLGASTDAVRRRVDSERSGAIPSGLAREARR